MRNYRILTSVGLLTHVLLSLPSLLWLLPVFAAWSSCLLVSSVNHQTSFQYIPFRVSQARLVAVIEN